jgi:hypothetical protein
MSSSSQQSKIQGYIFKYKKLYISDNSEHDLILVYNKQQEAVDKSKDQITIIPSLDEFLKKTYSENDKYDYIFINLHLFESLQYKTVDDSNINKIKSVLKKCLYLMTSTTSLFIQFTNDNKEHMFTNMKNMSISSKFLFTDKLLMPGEMSLLYISAKKFIDKNYYFVKLDKKEKTTRFNNDTNDDDDDYDDDDSGENTSVRPYTLIIIVNTNIKEIGIIPFTFDMFDSTLTTKKYLYFNGSFDYFNNIFLTNDDTQKGGDPEPTPTQNEVETKNNETALNLLRVFTNKKLFLEKIKLHDNNKSLNNLEHINNNIRFILNLLFKPQNVLSIKKKYTVLNYEWLNGDWIIYNKSILDELSKYIKNEHILIKKFSKIQELCSRLNIHSNGNNAFIGRSLFSKLTTDKNEFNIDEKFLSYVKTSNIFTQNLFNIFTNTTKESDLIADTFSNVFFFKSGKCLFYNNILLENYQLFQLYTIYKKNTIELHNLYTRFISKINDDKFNYQNMNEFFDSVILFLSSQYNYYYKLLEVFSKEDESICFLLIQDCIRINILIDRLNIIKKHYIFTEMSKYTKKYKFYTLAFYHIIYSFFQYYDDDFVESIFTKYTLVFFYNPLFINNSLGNISFKLFVYLSNIVNKINETVIEKYTGLYKGIYDKLITKDVNFFFKKLKSNSYYSLISTKRSSLNPCNNFINCKQLICSKSDKIITIEGFLKLKYEFFKNQTLYQFNSSFINFFSVEDRETHLQTQSKESPYFTATKTYVNTVLSSIFLNKIHGGGNEEEQMRIFKLKQFINPFVIYDPINIVFIFIECLLNNELFIQKRISSDTTYTTNGFYDAIKIKKNIKSKNNIEDYLKEFTKIFGIHFIKKEEREIKYPYVYVNYDENLNNNIEYYNSVIYSLQEKSEPEQTTDKQEKPQEKTEEEKEEGKFIGGSKDISNLSYIVMVNLSLHEGVNIQQKELKKLKCGENYKNVMKDLDNIF